MRASTRKLVTEALKKLIESDAQSHPDYSASVIELATFLERPGAGGRPRKAPTEEYSFSYSKDISALQTQGAETNRQIQALRAQVEKLQLKSGLKSIAGA